MKPTRAGLGGFRAKPGLSGAAKPGQATAGLGGLAAKPSLPKPGLGGGAAPKPSAPKPPVGQKPEFDSQYYNTIDSANRQGEERLGMLENREGDVKREFGIEDPTDPFSRANGLKRAFLARRKSASAQLASAGQLYSGAHELALSRTRREEEEARAQLRRAYEAAIGEIGEAKSGVKWETEEQRQQAFEDWLARAPEAEVPIDDEPPVAAPPKPAAPNQAAGQGKVQEPVVVNPGGQAQVGSGMKPQVGSGSAQKTSGNKAQGAGSINQKDKARARRQRERANRLRGKAQPVAKVGLPGGKPVKVRNRPKPKARNRNR